jgi:2-succinyl-6-hydroxy-2,4-cyclohexadiene-1-carboxylate synthase
VAQNVAAVVTVTTAFDHAGVVGHRIRLLHGFTQSARCWGDLPAHLRAQGHDVVALDLPGHGTAATVRADVPGVAARVAAQAPGPAVWLGYSFGARVALHVALDHPEDVDGVVLVSGTAGIDAEADRRARVAADEALADDLERDGVAAFLDGWLARPLFAGLAPGDHDRAERERNGAAGLASSLRLAGTGTMRPRWDDLGACRAPALVVAGADDARFVAAAERLAAGLGGPTTLVVVPGAGHTVHRERPAAFTAALDPWLAALPPARRVR